MRNLSKLIQKLEVNYNAPKNATSGNPVAQFLAVILSQAMVIVVKWLV